MVEALDVGSATITATSEGQDDDAPVSVVTSFTFSSVVTGGAHSCALTTDGAALCWGRGESGQLGVAPPSTICALDAGNFPCSLVPVAADGGLAFEQLAGGGAHTCGLTSDGTAWCWGDNADGELGDDSFTDRHAPVTVATALKFASIDAGARHTCALTSDGEAYCWGSNSRGQLGDGTTTKRSTPVAVVGGHSFQQVIAGGFDIGHTCGVLSSGATYCWGDNERGQLGIGSGGLGSEDLAPHPLPEPVPGNAFVQVSAGLGRHTCGLTEFGATWCWGENSFGALGNGLQIDSPVPVEVSGTIDFLQVVAGGFIGHSCGWTASGVAHCWGENERGQVGDGSTFDRLEPSAVAGDLSFTSLDAGFRHTCGSASSGATYCWGSGAAGQLGTNSTLMNEVPMAVQDPP
jgi:alpha-tubulin suppressor-like RCC1 family protein